MNPPAQRTVVITGAFGALGTAVARRFLAQGARLGLRPRLKHLRIVRAVWDVHAGAHFPMRLSMRVSGTSQSSATVT
jgi:NAD(P)-dependent dehydrogenase (short-subunit alcohol dehydrogenase family)